eukprot:1544268-Rhodomonas_salina.3
MTVYVTSSLTGKRSISVNARLTWATHLSTGNPPAVGHPCTGNLPDMGHPSTGNPPDMGHLSTGSA